MDDRRHGDDDNRLDLERIREALEQGDKAPEEPLPLAGFEDGEERALPELPQEQAPDLILASFAEGSSAAPVEEVPLKPSEGLAQEQLRGLHTGGRGTKEDEANSFGAGKPLPQGHEQVSAPKPASVGGAFQPRMRSPDRSPPPRPQPNAGPWSTCALSALAGSLVFLLLFIRSLATYRGLEYMGVSGDDLSGQIVGLFRDTIILAQLSVLGLHLAFGALAGLVAGLLLLVTRDLLGLRVGRLVTFGAAVAAVLITHGLVLGHAMALQPQIFADSWYAQGGLGRVYQVFFSDLWPVWATPILGLAALLYLAIGGAFVLVRRLDGRTRFVAGLPIMGLALVLVAVLLPARASIPASTGDRLNVVILSADSLRADALTLGTEGGFARLIDEGVVFRDAWTAMPRTLPAWVSFLTGHRPFGHGIRHMFPTTAQMDAAPPTLVNQFRDAGYQTGVFSDFAGDIFSRMDFGFETVRAPSFSLDDNVRLASWKPHLHLVAWLRTFGVQGWIPNVQAWERMPLADVVTDEALDWLARRDPKQPFLMTVFWSSTHFPFAAPWPFHRGHASGGYDGPNRYLKTDLDGDADEGERVQVRSLYEGGVAAVDREVARVLEALDEAGLLERTVVLLLADHGENLYEHDFGITHGDHLYGEHSHRIPFIVRLPGGAGGLGGRTARGIDVAPTLLGLAGLGPLKGVDGVGLFDGPIRPGEEAPSVVASQEPPAIYSETGLVFSHFDTKRLRDAHLRFEQNLRLFDVEPHGWNIILQGAYRRDFLVAKHRMWLRWPHKLLYIPTRQGPRWELYDLDADPGEKTNLFSEDDPLSRRLRDELVKTLDAAGDAHLGRGYLIPR